MESHHLDFMSPANETPRERNFDDVYSELNREDALIIEEHLNNLPTKNFNYNNCLAFIENYLINRVVDGNYEIMKSTDNVCTIAIDGSRYELWIANGSEYFRFFDTSRHYAEEVDRLNFTEKQKEKAYAMVMAKLSEMPETVKSILQKEIDLLIAKMNAL